jgi:kynurenine formamidase
VRPVLPITGRACAREPTAVRLNELAALAVLHDLARLRVVDLTYPLQADIPFWPGTGYAPFRYQLINTLERDGKAAGLFEMPEHMGTHIDAPNHFVASPVSVDCLAMELLIRPLVIFDITGRAAREANTLLQVEDIGRWEDRNGRVPEGALAVVRSGWGSRWSAPSAFRNEMRFPAVSAEAARLLVEERHVVGIGVDTLSVDNGEADNSPCHRIVHGAGKYIIENLANLDRVPEYGAFALVAPVPIAGGTGAPARVFAFCNEEDLG